MTEKTNQELLSEITRAAITPLLIRQIGRGDHDFQLTEILAETAIPEIKQAALRRAYVVATKPVSA